MALLDDLEEALQSEATSDDLSSLYEEARGICLSQTGKRHWSRLVFALGVLAREGYWVKLGFDDGAAGANAKLELDFDEYQAAMDLWEFMVVSKQPLTWWRTISKARAKLLRKVWRAGIEGPRLLVWFEKARKLSLTELQAEVTTLLGKQAWGVFTVRAPVDLIEKLFEPALVLALPDATGQLDLRGVEARRKKHRFRCLEVVMAAFIAGVKRQEQIEAGQRVAGRD